MLNVKLNPEVLNDLEYSPFNFYLTGSRFFGHSNTHSDWDFFAENDGEVVDWLQTIGFEYHGESYPDDPQIATVYRFQSTELIVDVQLVRDIHKKIKVQNTLGRSNVLRHISMYVSNESHRKALARSVWKTAYMLLEN